MIKKGYDPDFYQKVKEGVSVQQVAELYGFPPNAKGLCVCPFHRDKHPSLKLYPNGKGFYCFSCGTGGDQIKLAALYLDVSNAEAAERLAAAFQIPVAAPTTYREKREAALKMKHRRELSAFIKRAGMYLRMYRILLCEARRAPATPHFLEAVHRLEYVDYLIECLTECPEEVYQDERAVRKIGEIEGRIAEWYFCPAADGTVSRRNLLSDF